MEARQNVGPTRRTWTRRHETRRLSRLAVWAFIVVWSSAVTRAAADTVPIDAEHSTVTVLVGKSGLFSAFADNHVISASIASGSISEQPPFSIDVKLRSGGLRVLDPGLAAEKRAEVQARMLGSDVLDAARFPDIAFASTTVEAAGTNRWNVKGRLSIHGQQRDITFPVVRANGRYRGQVVIKQRDFGIEPIKVAGGTVKVKDELTVQFDIAR
jgi:polyisoprenoid-binding protein YceI